jgi:hypothetical protein
MKENIFRALSLLVALGGILAFIVDGPQISQVSVLGTITFIAILTSFLLFGIGGSKLLSKLPFTEWLNENAGSFFTTGRDTIK